LSTGFYIAGAASSLSGDGYRLIISIAYGCQLFHRHVAARDGPLIVLFQHQGTDQANDGLAVWKDPNHVGAPLDFLIEAFQRVGAVQSTN
jgi:hypothetical protein